ncbi:transposase [Archangium sp.]|uniref:transposase n=1 Tax=Archangium sp. TaxID=1872627 RepID=UPI0039C893C7
MPWRVFFCTGSTRTARQVIESYCCRWAIEVLFRDLKQLLGFSSSRARSRLAGPGMAKVEFDMLGTLGSRNGLPMLIEAR